jgi:hypothetical protein
MTTERPKDVRDWAARVAAYPRRSPVERALVDHSILDYIVALEAENARLKAQVADLEKRLHPVCDCEWERFVKEAYEIIEED